MRRLFWLLVVVVAVAMTVSGEAQFIFRLPSAAYYTGQVRTASGCTSANINTEIGNSSSRDIVQCPVGGGSVSWTTQVVIPDTKGILLDLNGWVVTCSASYCGTDAANGNNAQIILNTNTAISTRITDGTIQYAGTDSAADNERMIAIRGSESHAPFRLDHLTLDSDDVGVFIYVDTPGPGIIDNSTLRWKGNNEVIQNVGYGTGSTSGWTNAVTPGSATQGLYVEQTTFTNNNTGGYGGGKTLCTYGSRCVFRFNTVNCATLDIHGNTPASGRWWEFYNNAFHILAPCDNVSDWMVFRGGTGLVFGNTEDGTNGGSGGMNFYEDSDGTGNTCSYPEEYQVGRGQNNTSQPGYYFLNDSGFSGPNYDAAECTNMIQEGRDMFSDELSATNVRTGAFASIPGTCSQYQLYWANDRGGDWWTTGGDSQDGAAYICGTSNDWTLYYTPATYPHTLQTSLERP